MAEYIEREALRAKAVYMHGFGENKYVPLKAIENAPAADVEKRVRCEDCVSSGGNRFGELICQNQLCPCYGREVDHAFSCILGERRDSDG